MKENVGSESQEVLPPNEQRINKLLKIDFVWKELSEIFEKVPEKRVRPEQNDYKPKFKFVYNYYSALYDSKRKKLFLAQWDTPHNEIFTREKLVRKDEFDRDIYETDTIKSANAFILRGAPDLTIVRFDSLSNFSNFGFENLAILRESGYCVMDECSNWITEKRDKNRSKILIKIPSARSSH